MCQNLQKLCAKERFLAVHCAKTYSLGNIVFDLRPVTGDSVEASDYRGEYDPARNVVGLL